MTIKLKRRNTGGALVSGTAPLATGTGGVQSGEAVWDNVANILYIGGGDDGSGNSTSIKTVAGTGAFVPFSSVGATSGVASLDGTGKVPTAQLPASVTGAMAYQGVWNASTNTPALTPGSGNKGYFYKVSIATTTTSITGTTSITSGAAALTVTGAAFASTDVGKTIVVPGAGTSGANLTTSISAFTSATQVTLAANASTSVSTSQTVQYGWNIDGNGALTGPGYAPFNVGDIITFDGTTWDKIDGPAEAVSSVAGRIGAVVLSSTDISGLGALATAASVNLATQATGTLAAAQIGALTGDVTSAAGSYATTIAANAVTNAKLASVGKFVAFSAAATLNASNLGNSIEATGSTAFTLTLPAPAGNSAPITTLTNASSAVLTLSTPAGAFSGYGSSGSTLVMPAGATVGIFSDGTNWIVADYSLLPVGNITGLGAGIGPALSAAATGSGGVALATSPAFAGAPTAPTATAGTNTTQLSTTAFVAAALVAYSPTGIDGGVV